MTMDRYQHKTSLTLLILFFMLFTVGINRVQCQEIKTKERIISAFTGRVPQEWGKTVKVFSLTIGILDHHLKGCMKRGF
jgi:hypothetical protein